MIDGPRFKENLLFALALVTLALATSTQTAATTSGQVIISTKMSSVSGIVRVVGEKIYLVGTKRVLLTVIDQAMRDSLVASNGKKRTVLGTPDRVSGTGAFLVTGLP